MKIQSHQTRIGHDSGVTLFELIVVLGILTGAALLAFPSAERSRRALPVRTVAIDLAATLKTARSAAMRSNIEQQLTIDLNTRRYWVDGQSKAHAIPRELTVAYDVPQAEQPAGGLARVRFRPDGSSSGGRITLAGQRQSAEISVDWLTGSTRIAWRR